MDGVVVKRYLREEEGDDKKYYLCRLSLNYVREEEEEEGDDIDKRCRLSLNSLKDYSVSEICKLSDFKDGAPIYGYNCHDWMCFYSLSGQFVVYNITTKEVKRLPSYNSLRLNNRNWTICYRSSGMGYDPTSDDYKVVRSFSEYHQSSYTVFRAELYSLKTGSLKSIPIEGTPPYIRSAYGGVYVGGRYYWSIGSDLECFDFTDETYSVIPGPPHGYKFPDFYYIPVQCRGHLGLILSPCRLERCEHSMRPKPKPCESLQVSGSSSSSSSSSCFNKKRKTFEVWVWNDDSSWTKLYDAALRYVAKPLCLIDDRISFFQGETRDSKCYLIIYNWITKEMKRLHIRDYPGHMQVFSGFELPPDKGSPMNGEEIKTDKAWLRPHNASLALKRKKTGTKTTTKSKTMCVGQNASLTSTAKRRRNRRLKKAFKEEDVSGRGLGEENEG